MLCFFTLLPGPTNHCWSISLLILSAVAAAARIGGLKRSTGWRVAEQFRFARFQAVFTSSGKSFYTGLHNFEGFPFLVMTRNTAPLL